MTDKAKEVTDDAPVSIIKHKEVDTTIHTCFICGGSLDKVKSTTNPIPCICPTTASGYDIEFDKAMRKVGNKWINKDEWDFARTGMIKDLDNG
jgi:hypothetical protein